MKKHSLKRRFMLGILLAILWAAAAVLVLLLSTYKADVFRGNLKVFSVWMMILWLFVLCAMLKKHVLEPIVVIYQKIRLFNEGMIYEEVFDSFRGISEETDVMFSKIESLLDKDKRIENAKQQARYLALQNQINPHFLYNVLESIRSDAIMAGIPEVGKIAEALSIFFRYTTSKMENLSTLQEELGNVENYFMIQKYRFEDKISLKIKGTEDDETINRIAIPKLTLQPIVENAIKHGLEPQVEGGTVGISIERTEKNVFISITDDGVGIGEDKLEHLNNRLVRVDPVDESINENGKGGIALLNVNSRIKLLMGEEYGVYVFSTPGIGTEVRLTLPYQFH